MAEALPAAIAGFHAVVSLPVQWGDQDMYGHVNNAVYFRWFETSRIAYLERIGLPELLEREGIGPILAAIGCNYRRQLKYPDTVQLGARVTRVGRSSITMEHALVSTAQRALVADGTSTIVAFDYTANRPVPVPEAIRAAISAMEQQDSPAGRS